MAEYIEREALLWKWKTSPKYKCHVASLAQCIHDAPAADVVEVVRCGQCFYSAHEGELWICVHPDQYCDCGAKIVDPGYFCGYGRRIGVVDENSDT